MLSNAEGQSARVPQTDAQAPRIRVALAGAGNVASHLAAAFAAAPDIDLVVIGDRTAEKAGTLASAVGVERSGALADIASCGNFDVLVVSVADAAIADVAAAIGPLASAPLAVHTSGTVSQSVLGGVSPRTGILYPLQSFTAGVPTDLSAVPFFIETSDPADRQLIERVARSLSRKVHYADERLRGSLHIAGVFANNFVNAMLGRAAGILAAEGLPLDVVEPLVRATVDKAFAIGPHDAQTGPARRGDAAVMARQLERLPEELRPLYREISALITEEFHSTDNTL